jgi:hypothetical protein
MMGKGSLPKKRKKVLILFWSFGDMPLLDYLLQTLHHQNFKKLKWLRNYISWWLNHRFYGRFFFDNNDFMDGWGILIPTGFHRQQRGV